MFLALPPWYIPSFDLYSLLTHLDFSRHWRRVDHNGSCKRLGYTCSSLVGPRGRGARDLKYNTFFQIANVLCTLLTKISISFYILRIKSDRSLRILLWILMVLMSLATVAVIAVLSISCIPLRALWTPSLQPDAKCLPLRTVYNVAYVHSGFTIVIDLFLTLSPVVILWNVRIKTEKKIRICVLMSLGLVATISNALRNAFQSGLTSKDPTCKFVPRHCCTRESALIFWQMIPSE